MLRIHERKTNKTSSLMRRLTRRQASSCPLKMMWISVTANVCCGTWRRVPYRRWKNVNWSLLSVDINKWPVAPKFGIDCLIIVYTQAAVELQLILSFFWKHSSRLQPQFGGKTGYYLNLFNSAYGFCDQDGMLVTRLIHYLRIYHKTHKRRALAEE
jgi:hypothetical protein